jgi:hypothetical protein
VERKKCRDEMELRKSEGEQRNGDEMECEGKNIGTSGCS